MRMSEEEKTSHPELLSSEVSEGLLLKLEDLEARLTRDMESMRSLLAGVAEYENLLRERAMLETTFTDSSRLLDRTSNSYTLRRSEERYKALVLKIIPERRKELLEAIEEWERSNGKAFLTWGRRYLDSPDEVIPADEEGVRGRGAEQSQVLKQQGEISAMQDQERLMRQELGESDSKSRDAAIHKLTVRMRRMEDMMKRCQVGQDSPKAEEKSKSMPADALVLKKDHSKLQESLKLAQEKIVTLEAKQGKLIEQLAELSLKLQASAPSPSPSISAEAINALSEELTERIEESAARRDSSLMKTLEEAMLSCVSRDDVRESLLLYASKKDLKASESRTWERIAKELAAKLSSHEEANRVALGD
ncbi:hypothetical protein GUITHDRAFT_122919 [Guillardia theta CCMP2712]|uniref:Uncharacterized protein n=1 Tax=Guillardia theta (strain CCMP2712) TaxID=905079 RepID=L1I4V4_GUITC|nr:hypothetical protein GUITHDRAFT_122919 [Guillardia theta CCMP2712]EKX30875.1 hypothetical protein GUITHDRAFT_122919 [Guillardia theta CCMP2712]|eukprot:XP_005817855.1 hypothetical protein GUITHDRAFT_122919 [Guillardia theta CCMP2712]